MGHPQRKLSPAFQNSNPTKCQEVFWKEVEIVPSETLFRCNFVWGIRFRSRNGAQKPARASDLAFSDDTFHLSFQQWVTHKGNYRPRSKTVTQLSASKFFGRKSKKSLPRPFLDVILCGEFDSGLEMGLRSLPGRQIWLFSAKPTTKKNCRRQFFFGVGEALLPSSAKKIIDRVPKQEPPYAIKIGVFRRHISLEFPTVGHPQRKLSPAFQNSNPTKCQ